MRISSFAFLVLLALGQIAINLRSLHLGAPVFLDYLESFAFGRRRHSVSPNAISRLRKLAGKKERFLRPEIAGRNDNCDRANDQAGANQSSDESMVREEITEPE